MEMVKAWVETVVIPTYEIGEAEKNPIFLDKRVYQGSCGKVYPYPTVESISDIKTDKAYTAVYLENEYLKVMILPELGGRIQRAYDKTNDYDFVYYNQVVKPALVGLTGPWISGGIEFNWPQHHRPTTFLPVDYELQESEDGSQSVLLHDVDQMYGTKGIAKITLHPGKAYIEINGQLYNRTSMAQTFLWWANPAVPVNDNTQSVFPPDVHAVMDHGKRDVSRFPIATGVYYKKNYSEGVDISRYKNIPVPTSYMAEASKYDFVGGYDYGKEAGILHVADHHISPGKKQWTWGCGDFGKAWDRNLTDEDGPYVELMTGVYTDNQPDFTWLKPFEEKTFTQYFMPYKGVGQVKNATIHAALGVETKEDTVKVRIYATQKYENAQLLVTMSGKSCYEETVSLSPLQAYEVSISCEQAAAKETELEVSVWADGECLVSYQPEPKTVPKIPEPAKAAKEPSEIMTNEELYLTGLHIEQYRHATYAPDPYYLEGLKRDPGDIRINTAYGTLLMRRGLFTEAEKYLRIAIKRLTERNPNPYTSESYYLLGLTLWYQGRDEEAYDAFYKAAWSCEQQEMSYYYLAAIDSKRGKYVSALAHVTKALVKNAHNIKARGLKAYLLRKLGQTAAASKQLAENLELDPFDFVSGYELVLSGGQTLEAFNQKMRDFQENYLMTARDYAEAGAYEEAISVLKACTKEYPMLYYYQAYYMEQMGAEESAVAAMVETAAKTCSDYCFPNKLEDIAVLEFAMKTDDVMAPYYLGNLYYDKGQWEKSVALWELAAKKTTLPIVFRNLSLAYYNRMKDTARAKDAMEIAYRMNEADVRIFLELDQLYKKLGMSWGDRLARYEEKKDIIAKRDDLYIEYITLVNMTGDHKKAYDCMMNHRFHPWEGGEGKITTQYTWAILCMAGEALQAKEYETAEELLKKALVYPENLGEGKLEGTKDNHVYYYLALALEGQGKTKEAEECLRLATLGTDEPAGAMYYNDQPADMILYQGLAYQKLGETASAKSRFYRLLDYGERHLEDQVKIEYFAVSLPDFLIFEDDLTKKNAAHCQYLMGLANLGLGNATEAEQFFKKALEEESSHMMSHLYKEEISKYLA